MCLLLTSLLLPVVKAGNQKSPRNAGRLVKVSLPRTKEHDVKYAANLLYDSLNLADLGMSKEALLYAYQGHEKLSMKGKLDIPSIITICDFTQSSGSKRMYIIDIENYKVLLNTYVAHGKNSGLDYAERFSNKLKSYQSSLGFYITKNTYHGRHGLSLRLIGLESGFNDKAEQRALVVHGAKYIGPERSGDTYMGRSFGCPAVPAKQASKVIQLIKGGTCLFIFHPSKTYLKGSKILNG